MDETNERIDLVLTHSVGGHYESSVVLEPHTRYKATLTPATEKPLNVRMAGYWGGAADRSRSMQNLIDHFGLVERSKVEKAEVPEGVLEDARWVSKNWTAIDSVVGELARWVLEQAGEPDGN